MNFLSSLLSAGCKTFPIVVVRTFISYTGFIHIRRRTRRMISSSYFCLWPDNIQRLLFRDTRKKTRVTSRLLQLSSDLTLRSRTQRLQLQLLIWIDTWRSRTRWGLYRGEKEAMTCVLNLVSLFLSPIFPPKLTASHATVFRSPEQVPFCLKLIVLLYKN